VLAPTPIWGIGRAGNSLVYSEQFRSVHGTRRTLYGSLNGAVNRLWRGRFNMRRRDFITLAGGAAAAWPLAAHAQQLGKYRTIGFLGAATPSASSQWVAALVERLRELGWIEGRTVAIEYRWAEGRNERLAEIAAEFVRLNVDVIVTWGTASVLAAKQATSVIPIVFASAGDPVSTGLVASLARPGGNVTGSSNQAADVAGKRLELSREFIPGLRHLAILAYISSPIWGIADGRGSGSGAHARA